MFENMTETQAREYMMELAGEYYDLYHKKPPYKAGDRISCAGRVYDDAELRNLMDATLEFWLTSGRYTDEFERRLAEYLNVRYCHLVNSGSSANLLAFMALTSPLLKDRRIERGDEVITVAAGFPTTVAPIIQYGAVPVFVDVQVPGYNIDPALLESALSSRTKAVMLAHTLGNPFDLRRVKEFCDRHGLWLIEDNCDSLGSEYSMTDGTWQKTGTIGDIGTSSFYPPHHMTMGEGGAVYTDDPLLGRIIRSLRDWGRDCMCPSGKDNMCGHRYDGQYGELPEGYDHKYVYSHFGYNLKATDLQAAIGCAQLEKLDTFTALRREHFSYIKRGLSELKDYYILPEATRHARPSWFGYAITCKDGISRNKVVQYLEEKGVQTRMLFAGNLTKHPCFDTIRGRADVYRISGSLEQTDRIMEQTFWIGVYPGMTEAMMDYMIEQLALAIR